MTFYVAQSKQAISLYAFLIDDRHIPEEMCLLYGTS
jgi:hypothetical protein